MNTPTTHAHSYRATIIPDGVNLDEVEFQADQGLLPTIRVKSSDAAKAMADAHRVSGRPIHSIERVGSDA